MFLNGLPLLGLRDAFVRGRLCRRRTLHGRYTQAGLGCRAKDESRGTPKETSRLVTAANQQPTLETNGSFHMGPLVEINQASQKQTGEDWKNSNARTRHQLFISPACV